MIRKLLSWLLARWRYNPATADVDIMGAVVVPFKPTQPASELTPVARVDTVHTPLADALAKPIVLPDVPDKTVTVKGQWEQATGNYGIDLEASVDIGKPGGWTTGATGSWWKDKGAAAMGWLQWKGK